MDIRYEVNPIDFKSYSTSEVRKAFLIESLFQTDTLQWTYSHYDRLVIGGAVPVEKKRYNWNGAMS